MTIRTKSNGCVREIGRERERERERERVRERERKIGSTEMSGLNRCDHERI